MDFGSTWVSCSLSLVILCPCKKTVLSVMPMRLYFRRKSLPELQGSSREDLKLLSKSCSMRWSLTWKMAWLLSGFMYVILPISTAWLLYFWDEGNYWAMGIVLSIEAIFVIFGRCVYISNVRTCYRQVRQDQTKCLKCKYSLTGNTSGQCPECGHSMLPPLPFDRVK